MVGFAPGAYTSGWIGQKWKLSSDVTRKVQKPTHTNWCLSSSPFRRGEKEYNPPPHEFPGPWDERAVLTGLERLMMISRHYFTAVNRAGINRHFVGNGIFNERRDHFWNCRSVSSRCHDAYLQY